MSLAFSGIARRIMSGLLLVGGIQISAHPVLATDLPRIVTVEQGAQDPAVSPDGQTVAVGILGKIWFVPINGGAAKQLTFGHGWDSHPAWSPDGRFVAYAHQEPGRTELLVANLATGTTRTLYATSSSVAGPGFSMAPAIGEIMYHPTKGEVYFVLEKNQADIHIYSVDLAGGAPTQRTFGGMIATEFSFAFSPDGKEMAVEYVSGGARELYRFNLESKQVSRLTHTPSEELSVLWTRDGKSLVYVDRDEGVEYVTVRSLADGSTHRIFSSEYDGKWLTLYPDGKSVVMVAGRRLYRINLATGKSTPIPFQARFELSALGKADIIIKNARLWDGTGRKPVEGANVEVRNGRIARVWNGQVDAAAERSTQVVDAHGRFLMSALMDSHFHAMRLMQFDGGDRLAEGIVVIRDPGGYISDMLNYRDAVNLGLLEGPEDHPLGPLIDGTRGFHPMAGVILTKPEAAAAFVHALQEQGAEGLKAYNSLTPEVLRAVVAAAQKEGIPVTGDIGRTSWSYAVDAGILGVNHLFNLRWGFVPDSLQVYRPGEPSSLADARGTVAADAPLDANDPRIADLFKRMAEKKVAFDPTIFSVEKNDAEYAKYGFESAESSKEANEFKVAIMQKAYAAGVPFLAGTDNGSLAGEMEAWEAAGIPNSGTLQAATINGAKWIGKEKDIGTVEVGKRAHLLLLDGDPLKKMSDIRKVALVLKDGRVVYSQGGEQ